MRVQTIPPVRILAVDPVCELVRVALAEHDRSGRSQARNRVRVARRMTPPVSCPGGRVEAGDVDDVLYADRDARQRTIVAPLVRCQSLLERRIAVDGDEGAQLGVEQLDAPQRRLRQFGGGEAALTDLVPRLFDRQPRWIGVGRSRQIAGYEDRFDAVEVEPIERCGQRHQRRERLGDLGRRIVARDLSSLGSVGIGFGFGHARLTGWWRANIPVDEIDPCGLRAIVEGRRRSRTTGRSDCATRASGFRSSTISCSNDAGPGRERPTPLIRSLLSSSKWEVHPSEALRIGVR